jgi:hypothetical protein
MYSVYGDTVLDPFWGTGTTTLAAMVAGRHSVGVELDSDLADGFADRVADVRTVSEDVVARRLRDHEAFVAEHDGALEYDATHYDVPVKTAQEQDIRFYTVETVDREENGNYRVTHVPATAVGR